MYTAYKVHIIFLGKSLLWATLLYGITLFALDGTEAFLKPGNTTKKYTQVQLAAPLNEVKPADV